MHLLLRKSQRDDGLIWSDITFELNARLELTADESELFDKYDLRDLVVYDSSAREQHAYSALKHYQSAAEPGTPLPLVPAFTELASAFAGIAGSAWHLMAGAAHEIASDLALRITLGTLIDGQHFESQDLEEILTVANNIQQSTQYLASYLEVALTFDGREQLSEH